MSRLEMWSHENSTLEFRQGYREGLEATHKLVLEFIQELKDDHKIVPASWVEIVRDRIDDELSLYEVGDEE